MCRAFKRPSSGRPNARAEAWPLRGPYGPRQASPDGGGGGLHQLLGAADAQTARNQHSPGTPTTGLREHGNDTSRSTGRSGPQNAATRRSNAKGRTGDCPGPHKETATRRNVTQGGGGGLRRGPNDLPRTQTFVSSPQPAMGLWTARRRPRCARSGGAGLCRARPLPRALQERGRAGLPPEQLRRVEDGEVHERRDPGPAPRGRQVQSVPHGRAGGGRHHVGPVQRRADHVPLGGAAPATAGVSCGGALVGPTPPLFPVTIMKKISIFFA